MARLVECWQLSQPLHLRHLALVRDTAMTGTIHHYIHYSAVNFRKRVDAGEAAWEAVEFISKNAKANNLRPPPVDAVPEVDGYGLPLAIPKSQLFKNGNASLLECMAVVKPQDYVVTSTDPSVVQLQDGTYGKQDRISVVTLVDSKQDCVSGKEPLPPITIDVGPLKLAHHSGSSLNIMSLKISIWRTHLKLPSRRLRAVRRSRTKICFAGCPRKKSWNILDWTRPTQNIAFSSSSDRTLGCTSPPSGGVGQQERDRGVQREAEWRSSNHRSYHPCPGLSRRSGRTAIVPNQMQDRTFRCLRLSHPIRVS